MKDDQPTDAMFAAAAMLLNCDERAIRAVAQVESGPLGAFFDSGEPVILFERHIFHRLTDGKFAGASALEELYEQRQNAIFLKPHVEVYAIISDPTPSGPGGYGPSSAQHIKLQVAVTLDRDAALRSCSWGLFQIMGFNHARAGYPELQRFINAMYRSVDDHLRAFTMFIRHDEHLVDALRSKEWAKFAFYYNGPAYRKYAYDTKLASAYQSA